MNYGDPRPAWAPSISFVTEYASVLACFSADRISVDPAPGGAVGLICPGWPEPVTNRACPDNEVNRSQYPRALVTNPVTFTLKLDSTSVVSSAVAGPSPTLDTYPKDAYGTPLVHGATRYVTISVRGRRLNPGEAWFGSIGPQPQWLVHERAIHGGLTTLTGITVTHTFETSSYDLPRKGRSFDFVARAPGVAHNLSAYRVQTVTPCVYEYRVTAEKAWPYWSIAAGRWMPQFVQVSSAWRRIDLHAHGAAESYDQWFPTRTGGQFRGAQFWDDYSGDTWVPVVEVQTVQQSN